MSHGFSTDTLSQEPLLPNQPFFSWLRTQTALFTSQILALLTIISALASLAYYLISLGHEGGPVEPKHILMMVVYAHLVFLIIFIAALIRVLNDNEQGAYRVSLVYDRIFERRLTTKQREVFLEKSKKRLHRFKRYFLAFWCSMLVLYAGFAFKYGVEFYASRAHSASPKESAIMPMNGKQEEPRKVAEIFVFPVQEISSKQSILGPKHENTIMIQLLLPVTSVPEGKTEDFNQTQKGERPDVEKTTQQSWQARSGCRPVSVTRTSLSGGFFPATNIWAVGRTGAEPDAQASLPAANSQDLQNSPGPESQLIGMWQVLDKFGLDFVIFGLNNASLLFLFSCFLILYLPALDDDSKKKQTLWFHYSVFCVVLLTLAFPALILLPAIRGMTPGSIEVYKIVFMGISGTLNAVALALLVARLDSKLFNVSAFLIFVLLTYAGLQPLFVIFESQGYLFIGLQTLVVVSALLFKLCLFCVLLETWSTGSMHTYLYSFPEINKRIDSIFENQFEFKTSREGEHGFSLSILKKNKLIYSTGGPFKSRAECDGLARTLRRLMKDEKNYDYSAQEGTHWVVVFDHENIPRRTLCESMPLRSREEAVKLKKESIDKLAFCKYNRS